MWRLQIISAGLAALFSMLILSSAHADNPSLSDTLSWMDNTYNPHSNGGAWGHGRVETFFQSKLSTRETTTFTYDGCKMSIQSNQDPEGSVYSEMYSSDIAKFDLKNIDPGSLKLFGFKSQYGGIACDLYADEDCDIVKLEFETRNELPLIDSDSHATFPKITGKEHEGKSSIKRISAQFNIDDPQYAKRFIVAFRHAIELCGGHASTF